MVEGHPVGDACAAVVADDVESVEAQLPHQGNAVAGHGALAVGLVGGDGRGFGAVPVPTQVRGDDREPGRQVTGDRSPHQVRLRVPVQQEQRRTGAAGTHPQRHLPHVDLREVESVEAARRLGGAGRRVHGEL